MRKNYMNFV